MTFIHHSVCVGISRVPNECAGLVDSGEGSSFCIQGLRANMQGATEESLFWVRLELVDVIGESAELQKTFFLIGGYFISQVEGLSCCL